LNLQLLDLRDLDFGSWIGSSGIPLCSTRRPLPSTYTPNFVQIGKTFCGLINVRSGRLTLRPALLVDLIITADQCPTVNNTDQNNVGFGFVSIYKTRTCLAARCLYASVNASTDSEGSRDETVDFVVRYDTLVANGNPLTAC